MRTVSETAWKSRNLRRDNSFQNGLPFSAISVARYSSEKFAFLIFRKEEDCKIPFVFSIASDGIDGHVGIVEIRFIATCDNVSSRIDNNEGGKDSLILESCVEYRVELHCMLYRVWIGPFDSLCTEKPSLRTRILDAEVETKNGSDIILEKASVALCSNKAFNGPLPTPDPTGKLAVARRMSWTSSVHED